MAENGVPFDPHCCRCPRLADYRDALRQDYPDYHAAPVPAFGDERPGLFIVGLAPGLHGANRSGRPFIGDASGDLLYAMLHRHGFSNRPAARPDGDGLALLNCRITNAVKCVPPENRPLGEEVRRCNDFLARELSALDAGTVILCLGTVAHRAVVRALGGRQKDYPFGHGAEYRLGAFTLLDSYHCSRYNTQTGRLTEAMFSHIIGRARRLVER